MYYTSPHSMHNLVHYNREEAYARKSSNGNSLLHVFIPSNWKANDY